MRSVTGSMKILLACLVVLAGRGFGQDREALTLPLAVEVAMRSHPLVRVAGAGREMAEAQEAEARGSRWPMVQLSETVVNGNNPVFVFGSLLEQARFREGNLFLPRLNNPDGLTNFRFGVSVRAPLFDQFQARADVEAAQIYAGYARITSPVEGLVVSKQAEIGGLAAPGVPLLTIEGTGRSGGLRLEATVEESRLGAVALGTAAKVGIDSLGGLELAGRVVEIVPAADPASRTFTVRIELPTNPSLRSGQFGRVQFQAGERNGLSIPANAVVRRGQLTGVYVIDEKGIANLRLITLGRQDGDRLEVLSGLDAGETIVAESSRIAREGVQVK